MEYVESESYYYNELVAYKQGSVTMYPVVTWIDNAYVSVFYFITNSAGTTGTFAQRGWCEVYRLEDGKKIDAWELAGKSESELRVLANSAFSTTLSQSGGMSYFGSIDEMLETGVADYVVLADGVYVSFPINLSDDYAHTFLVGLCPLASSEGDWSVQTVDLYSSFDYYRGLDRSHGSSLKVYAK